MNAQDESEEEGANDAMVRRLARLRERPLDTVGLRRRVREAIAALRPVPPLPDTPLAAVKSCHVHEHAAKRLACVEMAVDGQAVTLAVARAGDVRHLGDADARPCEQRSGPPPRHQRAVMEMTACRSSKRAISMQPSSSDCFPIARR